MVPESCNYRRILFEEDPLVNLKCCNMFESFQGHLMEEKPCQTFIFHLFNSHTGNSESIHEIQ